ncbi:MAG: ribulose-phosphate 3-epimerase [Firmicutes bacterium]|nr:ribulose-phosphate 3-epimerase [Bacillota bacterium]
MSLYKLSPSLLSCDFTRLGEEVKLLEKNNVPYIHIDVMDGLFVPNISIGIPVVECLDKITDCVLDTHLMIVEPERYIEQFAAAGSDIINFHFEACKDCGAAIDKIHSLGKKAGLTIKPKTSWKEIIPFLDKIDLVLVMSVEPGFGGQGFIEETLENVKGLAGYKKEHNLDFELEIDGGVKTDNLQKVIDAGAEVIVAGSAIFKGDVEANIRAFMEILK